MGENRDAGGNSLAPYRFRHYLQIEIPLYNGACCVVAIVSCVEATLSLFRRYLIHHDTEELKMSVKTLSKISMLALTAGLMMGCASTSDLKAVQQDANEAKSMARNAMDTANEAKSVAMDAKSVSMATEEKINRMFKKSMYK